MDRVLVLGNSGAVARFGEIEHSARLVMLRSTREIERFISRTS